MTFDDLEPGNQISLTISNERGKMQIFTKIMTIIDNSLVVEPLMVDGVVVNLTGNYEVEMLVIRQEGEVPIYWQRVRIDNKMYHEKECNVITSKLPGVKLNRRSCFRVGIAAQVKVNGIGSEPMNLNLRDLSANGFSLAVPKDLEIEFHKKLTIEYLDQRNQTFFELGGRPIRKNEMNGMAIYGGVLDRRMPNLEAYLTQKQMENRPNSRKQI
ncbi:MAG: hypothetical protein K6F90_05780 [Lachnospiraceae bacterium]|nr:hypothetical protein [Lachnospiraceae bacterium]